MASKFIIASKEIITRKEAVFLMIDFLKKKRALDKFVTEYKTLKEINAEKSAKEIIEGCIGKLAKDNIPFEAFFTNLEVSFSWNGSESGFSYWAKIERDWVTWLKSNVMESWRVY